MCFQGISPTRSVVRQKCGCPQLDRWRFGHWMSILITVYAVFCFVYLFLLCSLYFYSSMSSAKLALTSCTASICPVRYRPISLKWPGGEKKKKHIYILLSSSKNPAVSYLMGTMFWLEHFLRFLRHKKCICEQKNSEQVWFSICHIHKERIWIAFYVKFIFHPAMLRPLCPPSVSFTLLFTLISPPCSY